MVGLLELITGLWLFENYFSGKRFQYESQCKMMFVLG